MVQFSISDRGGNRCGKSKREGTFCTAGSDWKAGSDRDGDESIFGGWACAGGGYSGTWQDDHGDCFFQSDRTAEAQSAVYTGCTSVRSDWIYHLPEREKCVCISSGSRGLQPASGR